ncbi:hypothetical protein FRC10_007230 [Ceratobasidium sp. 414]|nr:hypothetical protein FRC10_007230 [Ceratobasidium sp. 414]
MAKSTRNQDQCRLRKVRERGLIAFPEIQGFHDPESPMQALIYVVSKSSVETERRLRKRAVNNFDDADDLRMDLGVADLTPAVLYAVPGPATRRASALPAPASAPAPTVAASCPCLSYGSHPAPPPDQVGGVAITPAHDPAAQVAQILAEFHDRIPAALLALTPGLAPTSTPPVSQKSGLKKASQPAAAVEAQPEPRAKPKPKARQVEPEPEPETEEDDSSELSASESNPPVLSESEAEGGSGAKRNWASRLTHTFEYCAKGTKAGTGKQQEPARASGSKTKAQTTTKAAAAAKKTPATKANAKAK